MLITSMILLQAAVQFSGCPYTVIAFSSAAECSSFLRLVSIKLCSGSFLFGGDDEKIERVLPVYVHPGPRLLCDCPELQVIQSRAAILK